MQELVRFVSGQTGLFYCKCLSLVTQLEPQILNPTNKFHQLIMSSVLKVGD